MIKKIQEDIVKAMKAKDSTTLNVLRAIKTAVTNAAVLKGSIDTVLSDVEVVGIIRKQHAQRLDSIEQYKKADRKDLYDKEFEEIRILEGYLPQELPLDQIENIIDSVIDKIENPTIKNMGQIMKEVSAIVNGRGDNKKISELIRNRLA